MYLLKMKPRREFWLLFEISLATSYTLRLLIYNIVVLMEQVDYIPMYWSFYFSVAPKWPLVKTRQVFFCFYTIFENILPQEKNSMPFPLSACAVAFPRPVTNSVKGCNGLRCSLSILCQAIPPLIIRINTRKQQ